jgi:flavin reductase (DIM6/NTAB) family NADH-FMN oxidoreductase RutF
MQNLKESEAMALSAPFPYALVTSIDKNGRPNAMGIAWATRTSFEPFLILISIDQRRYSHEGIHIHKEFVLNYPRRTRQMLPGFVVRNQVAMAIR